MQIIFLFLLILFEWQYPKFSSILCKNECLFWKYWQFYELSYINQLGSPYWRSSIKCSTIYSQLPFAIKKVHFYSIVIYALVIIMHNSSTFTFQYHVAGQLHTYVSEYIFYQNSIVHARKNSLMDVQQNIPAHTKVIANIKKPK